jgi:hypothetical protein
MVKLTIEDFVRMVVTGVKVGSSQPIPAFPKWVTLDVANGGFATGIASAQLRDWWTFSCHPGQHHTRKIQILWLCPPRRTMDVIN